jgi:hypothetical protein
MGMSSKSHTFGRWAPALIWVTLPFIAGPSFGNALDPRSGDVQRVASVGLWGFWAIGLAATLVPSTVSLTLIRIFAPAALFVAGWAALVAPNGANTAESVALAITSLAAVVALSAVVGDRFVNGSSYGDERRLPLRPPGVLTLGPIQIAWGVAFAGVITGPLLLSAHVWIAGAALTVVGFIAAAASIRILHQLSKRWVVFVPAGMVLVDQMALTDGMLTQRHRIASVGPAVEGTDATDLTVGALGLALQLTLTEPDVIIPAPPRSDRKAIITPVEVRAVLFTPSRPGWVLDEAKRRRLIVS